MENFFAGVVGIIIIVFFFWLLFLIVKLPIQIAKNRGITGSELGTITVLSWFGLLIWLTWIIALILAIVWQPKKWVNKDEQVQKASMDLDALEKLHTLMKKGVITKAQYQKEKKKLIGE